MTEKQKKPKLEQVKIQRPVHSEIGHEAIDRGISMSALVEEAWECYKKAKNRLLVEPANIRNHPDDQWHRKLAEVLASGDREAISAVQQNILVFHRIVGGAVAGPRREHEQGGGKKSDRYLRTKPT